MNCDILQKKIESVFYFFSTFSLWIMIFTIYLSMNDNLFINNEKYIGIFLLCAVFT